MSYSPLPDLHSLFNSPDSLNELPQLLSHTNQYKIQLNHAIAEDIIKYNKSYTNINQETRELITSITEIKKNANTTQSSISSMTSSIQSLDSYKKNLVLTMTIIKRLQMLISANNTLIAIIPSHNYREVLQLLSVIKQLLVYFKPYRSIDEINSINLMVINTQNKLVDDIFNDFEELDLDRDSGLGDSETTSEDGNRSSLDQRDSNGQGSKSQLLYGCEILYLIDPKYRDKLLNLFYNHQLKDIKMIFNISEEAGSLDNLNRRYIYFKKTLSTVQSKYLKIFPKEWKIDLELAKIFCKITSQDIMDLLRRPNNQVDSKNLMDNLFITLEFESSLNERFKTEEFSQIISKAFEPYLKVYISEQERFFNGKTMEFLSTSQLPEELIGQNESFEEFISKLKLNNVPNIANSSIELFKNINKVLNQVLRLSNGEILVDLSRLFSNVLNDYHNKVLLPILPQKEDDLRMGGIESVKYLSMLLNTGDYIINNINELQENLTSQVIPKYKNQISFESIKDSYFKLINMSVTNLLIKISLDLKVAWRQFENYNWAKSIQPGTNDSENRTISSYMKEMKHALVQNLQAISPLIIRDSYVRNFNDKLVELLINIFGNHLRFVKPLNLNNVEQIKRDLEDLKLLSMTFPLFADPNFDSGSFADDKITSKITKSYQNLVSREFSSLEAILNVIATPSLPIETLIENYFELIGDKSLRNFAKILTFKGIERSEQKKYVDNFRLQLRVDSDSLMDQSTLLSNIEDEDDDRFKPQNTVTTGGHNSGSEIRSPKILPAKITNLEKNLREFALNGENQVSKLNENFKNFGKFFRKDVD